MRSKRADLPQHTRSTRKFVSITNADVVISVISASYPTPALPVAEKHRMIKERKVVRKVERKAGKAMKAKARKETIVK